MEKIFSIVDKERGIVQVTTDDERYYIKESKDEVTGNPKHIWLPSATWICGYAPKGVGYYKWLAEHGWDEAEAIKKERGKYGSVVHKAIDMLLQGEEVKMDDQFIDPNTKESKTLTFEEYTAILSFKDWWIEFNAEHKVEVVENEYTLWNDKDGFAGTLDLLLLVDGEYYLIVDFKTSQYIWLSHEIQVSAYKHSLKLDKEIKTAILQIGYKKNKKNFKFTEIEDKFTKFLAAKEFWAEENTNGKPRQVDLPLSVSLKVEAKEEKKNVKTNRKNKNNG